MNFSTLKKSWLLVAVAFLFTLSANAQKNRPLLEEYTGAWCGWCPDGEVVASGIVDKNPDVIWVAIHNGDPMKIAAETELTAAYISGFPSGTVDRRIPTGGSAVGLNRGTWASAIAARLNAPVEAAVTLKNRTYNQTTRQLTVDLETVFKQAMTGDYNVNLYIVEDEVTGPSPDYDQHSYLNNTSGHPYYGKGDVMPGFKHRYVVREMVGGAWGESGIITSNPANGSTFTKTYTLTLNSKYNAANVYLVGLVQKANSANKNDRVVVNADKIELIAGARIKADIATVTNFGKVPSNTADFKSEVEVTNSNANSVTVNLSVNTTNSIIPASWNVSVNPATLTIPAGGKAKANIVIKNDAVAAFAKVNVSCMPQVSGGVIGIETNTDYYVLSESAKNVIFTGMQADEAVSAAYYTNMMSKAKFKDNTVMMPLTTDIMTNYTLSNFDLMILPMDFANSRDKYLSNTDLANALTDAMNAGKRVIISGELSAYNTFKSANASPAMKSYMTNMFGITGTGNPIQRVTLNTSGQITAINSFAVNGVSGDELGNGLKITTNQPTQAFPYYNIYTDAVTLNTSGTGKAFLTYENANLIGGVRAQKGDARAIYLTFSPEAIPAAAARNAFINKIIDWVTAAATPTADIAVLGDNAGETVDFGKVGVGKTVSKTFDIKNTGKADLVVSEITWDESMPGWFKLGGNVTFPFTVAGGTTKTLTIECTAKEEGDQISFCTIKSNAVSGEKSLGLLLQGVKTSSVEPGTSGDGVLSVSAGPNPFSESTKINYTVGGATPQSVSVNVVDALGNTVATLANGVMAPGAYNATLSGAAIAAGTYRVVVTTGTTSTYVPVVLVK